MILMVWKVCKGIKTLLTLKKYLSSTPDVKKEHASNTFLTTADVKKYFLRT
jgi:hypothetical protein